MKEYVPTSKPARVLALVLLPIIIASGCSYSAEPDWESAVVSHQVMDSNSLETLWIREDVYTKDNLRNLTLAASGGKVFLLGSIDIAVVNSLIAFDIFTGNMVWKSNPKPLSTLFANEEGVYVGQSGGGGRTSKYDPVTGKVQWSRFFWYASGVLHLLVYGDQLHDYLAPDTHRILRPSDGRTVSPMLFEDPPFFDSTVCGENYDTPVYSGDTVYFRTIQYSEGGNVCAVDISTGKLRWRSQINAISNIVVKRNAVFLLIENGELLALNPANGQEIPDLKISFDNTPFVFDTNEPYFIAYEEENNILLVYLGDSRQLFAFKNEE